MKCRLNQFSSQFSAKTLTQKVLKASKAAEENRHTKGTLERQRTPNHRRRQHNSIFSDYQIALCDFKCFQKNRNFSSRSGRSEIKTVDKL